MNEVTRILRNPSYAEAFSVRTRFHEGLGGGDRVQRLPGQEWHTLVRDGHAG